MLPKYKTSSFLFKSKGICLFIVVDKPKSTFIQLLKKKVGPIKYNKINKIIVNSGYKSKKKLKNKNSAIKKIDPGNPKNTRQFNKLTRKSLGHKKFIPLTSFINLVLNRLFMASTSKKEFAESIAWLISIQKLERIKQDCPLIIHIVNQCISTTVE
jgi:hypothetical protein